MNIQDRLMNIQDRRMSIKDHRAITRIIPMVLVPREREGKYHIRVQEGVREFTYFGVIFGIQKYECECDLTGWNSFVTNQ